MSEEIRKMSIHKVYDYAEKLKLTNQALSSCLKIDKEKIDYYVDRCEHLEKVLDEIREWSKKKKQKMYKSRNQIAVYMLNDLLEILDKVKE